MATDTTLDTDARFAAFTGELIRPGDVTYDEARAVYNGMIDKRPAVIVRPRGAADVIDAVGYAADKGLPVAIRCGGHSVSGKAVVDDGVLIDLSSLKGVHVDPDRRIARANGGVLWGEYDRETQLFGMATPGGRVTTTGVGGFTLGGGYGWLSPVHGLSCDNLVAAELVTADGRLVRASEDEHPDLFWALRGGSGNFGVVTSYEFKVHPLGPLVTAGLLIHPMESARDVAREYLQLVENAPEQLVTALAVILAPPEEFVPPEVVGKPVLGMVAFWAGDPATGGEHIAALRKIGPPAIDLVQDMPYTAFQAMLDPFAPRGWRNYHRGEHVKALTHDAIDTFLEHGSRIESPMTQAILFRHGGAVSRVPAGATAAGHRDAPYMFHPIACWQDAAEDERHIQWARDFSDALRPVLTGGVYLNFEQDEGEGHVRAGYDQDTYARLVAVKDTWDPGNMFRVNQNIRPSRELPGQRIG
jgi:FAD/FMN-containing dehydrogenase